MNDPRIISDADLDLVETERIMKALFRRFPAVLCAVQVRSPIDGQTCFVSWSDRHAAFGLINDAIATLNRATR
jgi:hypothetical protein